MLQNFTSLSLIQFAFVSFYHIYKVRNSFFFWSWYRFEMLRNLLNKEKNKKFC